MDKFFVVLAFFANSAFAHTALMSCFDNGDNTITCEGGFSDGSTASGVKFQVLQNGKALIDGRFNENSEFTFDKPNGNFEAYFDAGEGHKVLVKSSDISQ